MTTHTTLKHCDCAFMVNSVYYKTKSLRVTRRQILQPCLEQMFSILNVHMPTQSKYLGKIRKLVQTKAEELAQESMVKWRNRVKSETDSQKGYVQCDVSFDGRKPGLKFFFSLPKITSCLKVVSPILYFYLLSTWFYLSIIYVLLVHV